MPIVSFIRMDLAHLLPLYRKIRHTIIGSDEIKRWGRRYLPMPNPDDQSKENKARYDNYKHRAVFYEVTARTLAGLMGQVFSRDPVSEIPDEMDIVENDATGSGVTLDQLAKMTLGYTLSFGRSGLMVDYPSMTTAVTKAQQDSGEVRPVILSFGPEQIINWRTLYVGAEQRLSLVVITETWPYFDDGFEIKTAAQFRVLRLTPDLQYVQEIWREPEPTSWVAGTEVPKGKNFVLTEQYTPTGPDGKPFDRIPFLFVGVNNNDESIDRPPLSGMVELNLAHYRNSADYEEACYMLGQPTYWFSGLTEAWVKDVLKGQIRLGSAGGVMLPAGSAGGLLQPLPNTMVKEAMDAKERQMVALGAKLVEQQQVQRTATEASQTSATETSILSSAAKNVTKAYTWALNWCALYMGLIQTIDANTDNGIKYELNSDFAMMTMSATDRAELIKEWQAGALTFPEMRAVLRKVGVATEDDDAAATAIAAEQMAAITLVHTVQSAAQEAAAANGAPAGGAPTPTPQPSPTPTKS